MTQEISDAQKLPRIQGNEKHLGNYCRGKAGSMVWQYVGDVSLDTKLLYELVWLRLCRRFSPALSVFPSPSLQFGSKGGSKQRIVCIPLSIS